MKLRTIILIAIGLPVVLLALLVVLVVTTPTSAERVERIIVAGPRVGAVTIRGSRFAEWFAYETKSDGLTWIPLWRLEGEPLAHLYDTPVQTSVRDPSDPSRHYRIAPGNGRDPGWVEVSKDEGITWQLAWAPPRDLNPVSRLRMTLGMLRNHRGPTELVYTPDGEMLLVSLGSDGIARMDRAGRWSQHAVGSATP